MSKTSKRFNRFRFIVDSRLQFSIVAYFMMIGLSISITGYFVLRLAFATYIQENNMAFDQLNVPNIIADLEKSLTRDYFVAVISALSGIFVGGILISHRIAGPLHRFERSIKNYLSTGTLEEVHLRKHDFGKNLATLYNQLLKTITSKT